MDIPFGPQNVLKDPMTSALNPNVISYIADMVSRQVRQQEKHIAVTHIFTNPILLRWKWRLSHQTSKCQNSRCSTVLEDRTNTLPTSHQGRGLLCPSVVMNALLLQTFLDHSREQPSHGLEYSIV